MRLIAIITFLFIGLFASSQTFLDSYKKFKTLQIKSDHILDSLRKSDYKESHIITKKKIRKNKKERLEFLEIDMNEFKDVFFEYKAKTGFDFNIADTLLIFYQTGIESQLREFLIVSGKDTVSFAEKWKMTSLHHYERDIIYTPFFISSSHDIRYVTDRDTLLTLVSKNDIINARKLEKEHPVLDGASSTVITAKRMDRKYLITEHDFHSIGFVPIIKRQ